MNPIPQDTHPVKERLFIFHVYKMKVGNGEFFAPHFVALANPRPELGEPLDIVRIRDHDYSAARRRVLVAARTERREGLKT